MTGVNIFISMGGFLYSPQISGRAAAGSDRIYKPFSDRVVRRGVLKIAHRGYVLETGRLILEGTADELLENKDVQRAYLGRDKKEIWER